MVSAEIPMEILGELDEATRQELTEEPKYVALTFDQQADMGIGVVANLVAFRRHAAKQILVAPEDWKLLNKDKVVAAVLKHVKPGDIVLLHDFYPKATKWIGAVFIILSLVLNIL